MRKYIIILALFTFSSSLHAQFYKDMEVKAGANFAQQENMIRNEKVALDSRRGIQLGVAKSFPLADLLFVPIEIGYAQMGGRVEQSSFENEMLMQYLYASAGIGTKKKINAIEPFVSANYRYGYLLSYNPIISRTPNSIGSNDHGVQLKAGLGLPLEIITPFIEFGFYQGLNNISSSPSMISDNGEIVNSEINNSALSILLGVRF
ncbi:outer membrane beta-barrel protein [Catalinimonas sp. 4WD22]|uniref:outer membrane beta-barrel protein n=1 Tax=Catalinimonas locisalis TaxID=3133978 RepID=UPI0031019C48